MFERVRSQITSGVPRQKQAAVVLQAVESLIAAENEPLTPVAYFACLFALLEEELKQGNDTFAIIYLLTILMEHVDGSVFVSKSEEISSIFSVLLNFNDDQSLLRNTILCTSHFLSKTKNKDLTAQLVNFIVDKRPKIRKVAVDGLIPALKLNQAHEFVVNFIFKILSSSEDTEILHVLNFLKKFIVLTTPRNSSKLIKALLSFDFKSPIIFDWIFQIIHELVVKTDIDFHFLDNLVKQLLKMAPYENDSTMAPQYLELMTTCFSKLSQLEINSAGTKGTEISEIVSTFFCKIFNLFDCGRMIKPAILSKATILLSTLMTSCVNNSMVSDALSGSNNWLSGMLKLVDDSLKNIRFRDSWGYILIIAVSVFERLGRQSSELVKPILTGILAFRDDKAYASSFPFKQETESAIIAAINSLGLDHFVELVLLNIENQVKGNPCRPYMLALIMAALQEPNVENPWIERSAFGPHSLDIFVREFIPLAQRLLEKASDSWSKGKQLEGKLYETLGLQVWQFFPYLCESCPNDVETSFSKLAPILGKILQTLPNDLFSNLPSQPDFRPWVCEGLTNLIESLQLLANLTPEEGDDNATIKWKSNTSELSKASLTKIKVYVNRFLAALCNIYTTPSQKVLEAAKTSQLQMMFENEIQHYGKCIVSFLSIADSQSISEYFLSMVNILLDLQKENIENTSDFSRIRIYTVMDLSLILIPYLEVSDRTFMSSPLFTYYQALINLLTSKDSTLLKKTYKSINLIMDIKNLNINIADLTDKLLSDECISVLVSGCTRLRIALISKISQMLYGQKLLDFIPHALPEIMLATKEASEKSRDTAYNCLVSMGQKMIKDGNVSHGSNETQESIENRNIEEFIIMIVAGLSGSTSNMQSASIASLSRIIFEFHSSMRPALIDDILSTIFYTLNSSSQVEIIKACLGFIKVAVVTTNVSEENLPKLISSMLGHSKHKSKFRVKVRHILERLIRKCGYELIDQHIPEDDKKLIINIKKRRERLRKKKNGLKTDEQTKAAPTFEDALHGSESELGSDEEFEREEDYLPEAFTNPKTRKEVQIREDDEVIDFLDSAVISQVTNTRVKSKKPEKKVYFETNAKGQLIIDSSGSDEENEEENEKMNEISEDYYKMSLASEVSFTRKADGRIKFDKRKRSDTEDVGKRWGQSEKRPANKKQKGFSEQIGKAYKSSKALGDVKRAGMPEPHAYIPLSAKLVGSRKKTAKLDGSVSKTIKAAKNATVGLTRKAKIASRKGGNKKHK